MPAATITAMGLATSLGVDAATACAAARAGLTRPAELPVWIENVATADPEPVVGYPIPGLAAGFDGVGRLLRVVHLALADLARTADPDRLRQAHWLVALPEALPAGPPPDLSDLDAPPQEPPPSSIPRIAAEAVCAALAPVAGPLPPHRFAAFAGRVGFVEALGHAARLADTGKTAVVGAFDSLVCSALLGELHAHGRLRVAGAQVGLQPGEAGAFVVVEPDGAGALARLGGGALGREADHLYSGRPALGRVLAEVVERPPDAGPVWPVSDCNGEMFCGADWGQAIVRSARLRAASGQTLYPATSVGDTGAASAAVGLVLAVRAFVRGYAPAPTALLLASGALGARGAVYVHAA